MRIFITGIAGFIGFHVAYALKDQGHEVLGLDNFNPYYDPKLKKKRAEILNSKGIAIEKGDICTPNLLKNLIISFKPTHVLHLAAQAGVRYSLKHPEAYVKANIEGFTQVLEAVKDINDVTLVYASSSSVYGLNSRLPYSVKDQTDNQASFYGVTKKSNELMAATYQHLYGLRAIGLRYFTVYGPWGRPDMALFQFTQAILEDKPIELYNFGNMERDFTYIDDIVNGTVAALKYKGSKNLFNLGNHSPVKLTRFVEILEKTLGKTTEHKLLPIQPGDVLATYADITESKEELSFYPKTPLEEGIPKFVDWYKNYF